MISEAKPPTIVSKRRPASVCDHGGMTDRTRELPGRRVEADLRTRLTAGEWQPGERLPPVSDLAEQYGVAKNTVLKALRRIETDGLVEIVPNWGTFRSGGGQG